MLALTHVALNVNLCAAATHAPLQTTTAMQVTLVDRDRRVEFDRTFSVEPNGNAPIAVAFDAPAGSYRLVVRMPAYACNDEEYVYFLAGQDRRIATRLDDGASPPKQPSYLLAGTIEPSLAFLRPTPVAFAGSAQCNEPPGEQRPSGAATEYDADAYYTAVYGERADERAASLTLALQLTPANGPPYYVYVPMPLPIAWNGWPLLLRVDITKALFANIAPQNAGLLVCPKVIVTSSG
jgi:hypothetical protein